MSGQDLGYLVANSHGWMKGDRRLLIDQGDASAANPLKFPGLGLQNIPALEPNATLLDSSVCWKEAQKRCGKRAFPGSRFAKHAQNFAGSKVKTDVHKCGTGQPCPQRIDDMKIPYFENEHRAPDARKELALRC
jgi:hypothetical protein